MKTGPKKVTIKKMSQLKNVKAEGGTPKPNTIYQGDCIKVMQKWKSNSIDACITDPPYNMSKKNGLGWAFSKHITMQEEWDRFSKDDYYKFTHDWLREVVRVVKPNGNIFVFGSFHNIYLIGFLLQNVFDRKIINSIVWFKPNAQPNITCRMFTESSEQIIWACNNPKDKAKKWCFNYDVAKKLNEGKQMRNVWQIEKKEGKTEIWENPVTPRKEKEFGAHPTQKPISVLERIMLTATEKTNKRADLVLDCFGGAGSTAVAAKNAGRKWVLIEKDANYSKIAKKRIENSKIQNKLL